jgi:hypothetical protein
MGKQNSLKKYIRKTIPLPKQVVFQKPVSLMITNPASELQYFHQKYNATLNFKARKPHTVNMRLGFVRIIKLRCSTTT